METVLGGADRCRGIVVARTSCLGRDDGVGLWLHAAGGRRMAARPRVFDAALAFGFCCRAGPARRGGRVSGSPFPPAQPVLPTISDSVCRIAKMDGEG